MISVFSTAKAFTGHQRTIQLNALESWRALGEDVEILLFGDEEGLAAAAERVDGHHVPEVPRTEQGTPLVSAMFQMAQDRARYDLLVFANADIIFLNGLRGAIEEVASQFPSFLMTGRRVDLWVEKRLGIRDDGAGNDWRRDVADRVQREGQLHRWTGLDYFVFPRGAVGTLPELAVGRIGWDNYLTYRFRKRDLPVIDATDRVTVVHQNHDYSHISGGRQEFLKGAEARKSRKHAGDGARMLDVRDATHRLEANGIRRASPWHRPVRWFLVELMLRGWEWPLRAARRFSRLVRTVVGKT